MTTRRTTRRTTAAAAATLALAAGLSGCSGFTGGGDDDADGALTFTTWASESEQDSFEKLVAQFESEHDGATVDLNVVPYDQMFSNIDAQLSTGDAPVTVTVTVTVTAGVPAALLGAARPRRVGARRRRRAADHRRARP